MELHHRNKTVRLALLNDAEYTDFGQRHLVEYVRQRVNAGEWPATERPERAREALAGLLSDSLRGAGHLFFKAVDSRGERVGWLWVAPLPEFFEEPRDKKRWLNQITVEETRRRQGYGLAMLAALHDWLGEQGVEELWLRVYDWNEEASGFMSGLGMSYAAVSDRCALQGGGLCDFGFWIGDFGLKAHGDPAFNSKSAIQNTKFKSVAHDGGG